MRVLLDTHVFLWWITDDPRLSPQARSIIADTNNQLFLSAASGWEIAIKAHLGKIEFPANPASFISEQPLLNAITSLPVRMEHVLHVYNLPDYHRDPFDRLLIAQSQIEEIPILTSDPLIARYPVKVIW